MNGKLLRLIHIFCFSLALVASGSALYAQSVQHGLVQEYHGSESKTPLKNVSVSAANASAVISDDKGEFTLNFRTLHAGDAIQFRRVELSGYEVMNTEALEAARVARDFNDNANPNANLLRPQDARTEGSNPNTSLNGKPSTLNIVMIKREALLKLRDGYRSVAAQRYEKQLKASEAEIERLKKEGQLAEEQYNERMNALEEEYEEKLSKLETYIDKFARIDLSALDADEQQIIDLVQAGDFDAALDLYDKQNLADRLRQSREDQQKLVAMRDQLDEAARQKAVENQRLRQSIDRQVTLLKMAGGEANFLKAHKILEQTFLADTTNCLARKEYAISMRLMGLQKESMSVLENGIKIETDPINRGLLIVDLMATCWNVNQSEKAYAYADSLIRLVSPFKESNYIVGSRLLPYANLYKMLFLQAEDRVNECSSIVETVKKEWLPDTMSIQSLTTYISLLDQLNDYYSLKEEHDQTLWCARESIFLGAIIERKYPWTNVMCLTGASACSTFLYQGLRDEALIFARRTAELMDRKLEKFGSVHTCQYGCYIYYLLADALVPAEEYLLADSIMQVAERRCIFEKVLASGADLYKVQYGVYLLCKSRVYIATNRLAQAIELKEKAIEILQQTEDGPNELLAMKPDIEARVELANGRYKAAASYAQQLIDYTSASYKESHDGWDADNLCRAYLLMTEIHLASGQKIEAKKSLKEAQRVAVFPLNKQAVELLSKKM